MKFKHYKEQNVIGVFTNYLKDSCHMGNILSAKKFGYDGLFFDACGKEQWISAKELRKIADKMDAIQEARTI